MNNKEHIGVILYLYFFLTKKNIMKNIETKMQYFYYLFIIQVNVYNTLITNLQYYKKIYLR